MTTRTQLLERIKNDPRYAHVARMSLDHAIHEIRRLKFVDEVYWGIINKGNEYEEEAWDQR